MEVRVAIFLLVSTVCLGKQHTDFIIVGGTGDLARKYLWDGALDLFVHNYNENTTFSFYAAARVPQNSGDEALQEIMQDTQCGVNDKKCHHLRPQFRGSVKYIQLKTPIQYEELCQNFTSKDDEKEQWEIKTIFYLSVPSSAYESVAKNIHDNCRHDGKADLKVVLEKPFGSDKKSAIHQTEVIGKYFKDSEIYRVDHYLAKSVTKHILQFRQTNRDILETLMTKQYVDRVEIVMKETIGVKGRIDFYDQTGVVRDVMQNHLTELLALIAMEIPANLTNSQQIEKNKLYLLRHVKPVMKNSLLLAQYANYLEEAKLEKENISSSQYTPTFGTALLRVDNPRWSGVPFLLASGKHLDERSSYVRILFREREFCVSGCVNGNTSQTVYPHQLVFQIGYGSVPSPGILVSRSLFEPRWPPGLQELSITSGNSLIHGQNPGDFHYAAPLKESPAYHTVLNDLYHGFRETFVTAERLLLLWDIWNDAIVKTKNSFLRLYEKDMPSNLNFHTEKETLVYSKEHINETEIHITDAFSTHIHTGIAIPKFYRNCALVCMENEKLIHQLSEHILAKATQSVHERGMFHVAFSGGSSPIPLFKSLGSNFHLFPWQHTHIWQVDERCVSQKNGESNFLSLYENMIKHVKIEYFNIHPMPIIHAGKICDMQSKGDVLYEESIKHLIPAQKFDLILLGIGRDGHTASLFPKSPDLDNHDKLVGFTKMKDSSFHRMSLLLPVLNNARETAVLVTGKEKQEILRTIADIETKDKNFPITYITPRDGNMTWFIDYDAWIGDMQNLHK